MLSNCCSPLRSLRFGREIDFRTFHSATCRQCQFDVRKSCQQSQLNSESVLKSKQPVSSADTEPTVVARNHTLSLSKDRRRSNHLPYQETFPNSTTTCPYHRNTALNPSEARPPPADFQKTPPATYPPRKASAAIRVTSASGNPVSRAITRHASYSGATCTTAPSSFFSFTGTLPSDVSTSTISRSAS